MRPAHVARAELSAGTGAGGAGAAGARSVAGGCGERGADPEGRLAWHGAVRRLAPGGWTDTSGHEALRAVAHGFTWLRDLRALGTDPARARARALVTDWIATPGLEPVAERPDVTGARITAWLGHYDFFVASAEDGFRQRFMARLIGDARPVGGEPAGGRVGRAGADGDQGADRGGGGAAGSCGASDPGAALSAAGDRAPGSAGRRTCGAEPGGAARGAAGPDGDPGAAAGVPDPAAGGADDGDRADGAGVAGVAAWGWRAGAVQRRARRRARC